MVSARDSVTVDRPIHDVFAFLADCTNNHLWRRGVSLSARISDGASATGEGTRYVEKVVGPTGRRVTETCAIVRYEPPTVLELVVEVDGVETRARFTLARIDAGTTHVELAVERAVGRLMVSRAQQAGEELRARAEEIRGLPAAMKDDEA